MNTSLTIFNVYFLQLIITLGLKICYLFHQIVFNDVLICLIVLFVSQLQKNLLIES